MSSSKSEPLHGESQTGVEVALSAALAICFFTFFWIVGSMVATRVAPEILAVPGIILLGVGVWLLRDTAQIILIDLGVILLVVAAAHLVADVFDARFIPSAVMVLGGLLMGALGRKRFQRYVDKLSAKIGATLAVLVVAPVLVAIVAVVHTSFSATDIPAQSLLLPQVASGWQFKGATNNIRVTGVEYGKSQSTLHVFANRLPQEAWSKDVAKGLVEAGLVERGERFSPFAGDTASSTGQSQRHSFQYDLGETGGAHRFVAHFWYCSKLRSNHYAYGEIKDMTAQSDARDIEKMIDSFKCG